MFEKNSNVSDPEAVDILLLKGYQEFQEVRILLSHFPLSRMSEKLIPKFGERVIDDQLLENGIVRFCSLSCSLSLVQFRG